ncbi:hypothetical protein H0H92_012501 [Tricholoma furcatifolium]|nr:hypothetical protein H0H92_012501 [Tricholoma furcatifolium]
MPATLSTVSPSHIGVQGHPKAKTFRKKPFPLFEDIGSLIGDTTATGEFALSSTFTSDVFPSTPLASQAPIHAGLPDDKSSSSSSDSGEESDVEISTSQKRPCAPSVPFTPASITPAPKRSCTTGTQALNFLAESVNTLILSVTADSISSATAMASTGTPKKDRAFNIVCKEEGLSPYSIATARKVFRGSVELANEYLSFDTELPGMKEARTLWLQDECERVRTKQI